MLVLNPTQLTQIFLQRVTKTSLQTSAFVATGNTVVFCVQNNYEQHGQSQPDRDAGSDLKVAKGPDPCCNGSSQGSTMNSSHDLTVKLKIEILQSPFGSTEPLWG